MKLRDSRSLKQPELMIIPMIDIMFFLLVFFMLSTMYMVDLKTIPIKLPKAEYSAVDTQTTFAVSVKKDGSIWLGLLDRLKGAGVQRFGLATDVGAGK